MKILCFYEYQKIKEKFSKAFKPEEISFLEGKVQDYPKLDFYNEIEILSVFISSKLNKENIDKFPNLKLILTRSTGVDHIDLKYAKSKNIEIINIKNYGNIAVAEYTFGLLFEIAKKINLANSLTKKTDDFSERGAKEIESFELQGKTIGIIGTGMIGKKMIQIAQGFNMNILAFDKYPDFEFQEKNNFKYVSLNELLKNSDIISLHLPLLESTKHLIKKEEFQRMKNRVIILNTARGGLIRTDDFFKALKTDKIFAAGLDVLENEDCLSEFSENCDKKIFKINQEIIKLDKVIITPHNAFNSKEATERRIQTSIEEIKKFIQK